MFNTRILIVLPILFLFITTAALGAHERIRVVASISPLASIFSMIGGNKIQIMSLVTSNICPHHYSLKPSQVWRLKDAEVIAYIDDKFESFIPIIINNSHNSKIFKVSEISGLNVLKSENFENWHMWFDIDNIRIIMKEAYHLLSEIDTKNVEFFKKNYENTLVDLDRLEKEFMFAMSNINKNYVILSPSLEYLFAKARIKPQVFNLYNTIQCTNKVTNFVSQNKIHYVFISTDQDIERYTNLFGKEVKVIQLESENWSYSSNYEELLFEKFHQIINIISKNLK